MTSLQERKKLYRAMLSRDPRHDGRFYVGVKTTGIYCRPVCPAKPKFVNVSFYRSQAAAESAGFRPCLRCRPDLSPLSPQWRGTAAVMSRALALIEGGADHKSEMSAVAWRLGMSDRHLRRLFQEHIGASPVEVAISRRLHLARQLLSQTAIPVTEIAFASGFQSLRRFNDSFVKTYKSNPRTFRKNLSAVTPGDFLQLELPYALPFDWSHLLDFFSRHKIAGVEFVTDQNYARHFKTENGTGYFEIENVPARSLIRVRLKVSNLMDLRCTIDKIRRQFDLGHNPAHIEKTRFKKMRLLRVAGAFDPFEIAVAIILGQLVSTEQAVANVKKLVERFGEPAPGVFNKQLSHYFPTPKTLAMADLSGLGFTRSRATAIQILAKMVQSKEIDLSDVCDLAKTRQKLLSIKGIGPWTVEMIALRCLADPDAFPATDLIIRRAVEKFKIDPAQVSPWRAYLSLALWKSHGATLSNKRKKEAKI